MNLLFVNACIRPGSRTRQLGDVFLKSLPASWQVQEVDLARENPQPLNLETMRIRDQALQSGDFRHDDFRYARQFAQADRVLVCAPYWDMAYPAVLRAYLENICVTGLTFRYDESGRPVSLGRAREMVFITTSGGYIGPFNSGEKHLRDLCALLGIEAFSAFSAEGLDIWGNDVSAILEECAAKIQKHCESYR